MTYVLFPICYFDMFENISSTTQHLSTTHQQTFRNHLGANLSQRRPLALASLHSMEQSPLPVLLVEAAIKTVLANGVSCRVISAVTSAAIRSAMSMDGHDLTLVPVPAEVASRVPPIAAELAAQYKMTNLTGKECSYGHQAY